MKKILALIIAALLLTCATALATDVYTDDILGNYAFTLDGVQIQLPAPMSALLDEGWTFSDLYQGTNLPAMSYDSVLLYKDAASISVTVVNATDAELPLEDCSLAGVMLFATDGIAFAMDNGLSFDATLDDVLAVYGLDREALVAEYYEGSAGFTLSFYATGDDGVHDDKGINQSAVGMNQINFNFDQELSENGALESIELRYMDGAE